MCGIAGFATMAPQGGQQPRINTTNGNALIFNGEIYEHRAFDAELHGVEKTLAMIDGMFAFTWYRANANMRRSRSGLS